MFTRMLILTMVGLVFLSPLQAQEKESPPYREDKNPPLLSTYNPSIHHRRPTRFLTPHFGFSLHSDFLSKYMWRGIPSSLGAVWQPSFSLEYHGVGFSTWANFVLDNEPNQGQVNEVDLTLYYHRTFLHQKLRFRIWTYAALYPHGNPRSLDFGTGSLESDLTLGYLLGPVEFFTHLGVRLIDAPGSVWWATGVGYGAKLPLNFRMDTSVTVGVANGRFNTAHIAPVGLQPNLFEWNLSFPWQPVQGLHFVPNVHVSYIIPEVLRQAMAQPTNIWGGINIYYSL